LRHGLRASWSQPLLSQNGAVLGTFAMYFTELRSPSESDRQMIEGAGHIAVIAIERTRAAEALRRSAAYLAEAQRMSRTGSFGWSVATGELVWSEETFRIALGPTRNLTSKRPHHKRRGGVSHDAARSSLR
jgi:hypothetical protein